MPKCGLFVGGFALSLAEVSSVRHRADAASAVRVVQEIGELLQERNLGTEELAQQLSEYASAAVTPGAEGSFTKALQVVVQDLQTKIEKKIEDGQAATQSKLDTLFQGLDAANIAANTAKRSAVDLDKSWFKCAAAEQANRQTAEHAEKTLTDAKSDESQVCQRHQDSTGFKYDGTGKFTMTFACDHSVSGSCEAAVKTWEEIALQKMYTDAEAHLAKEQNSHDTLKASCEAKTQARVEAQSTLDSAESAWGTKRAACRKLATQRQTSMCDFGTTAQSKCSAEAEYAKLVAATKQAKGDADSEVDRESEWLASGATKCMINTAIQKGLNGLVAGADLDACVAKVNFGQGVGKLITRQSEFDTLSKANVCAAGPITFFNGETWNVPAGDKPSSKSYTKAKFTPQLKPASSNFDFCSSSPPPSPCDENDQSCECFAHRDPNFCKSCAENCGPCRAFCGVAPAPAPPAPEPPAPATPAPVVPAPPAPVLSCGPAALAKCKAKGTDKGDVPCIDLREGGKHHYLMWLKADGTVHVDGEANSFNDERDWTCSCSGACKGLVGTWTCPGFYESTPIVITPSYGDDFTATRENDHIDVCTL